MLYAIQLEIAVAVSPISTVDPFSNMISSNASLIPEVETSCLIAFKQAAIRFCSFLAGIRPTTLTTESSLGIASAYIITMLLQYSGQESIYASAATCCLREHLSNDGNT
ncbi:hypothetical protein ES705_49626 [subsurface metagenome]